MGWRPAGPVHCRPNGITQLLPASSLVLILSNDDVASVLTMEDCLQALEDAYREQAAGRAINQLRYDTVVPLSERSERDAHYEFKTMVGVLPSAGVAALRMSSTLGYRPIVDGRERHTRLYVAPGGSTVGLIQLYSVDTGEPLAFLPDGVLQGIRVGGTYGLAMKYLARHDASRLGLLGSGWQARFQVASACLVRPISRVKVFSPTREHREQFAREMSAEHGIEVEAVDSAAEAAHDVDMLVTATNASGPVAPPEFIQPGMHVAAVSGGELSKAAIRKADVVVCHSSEQPLIFEAGEGQYGRRKPVGEGPIPQAEVPLLEDVMVGNAAGRTREDQVTMFWSGSGMGIQFAAVGAVVLKLARERGLGQQIPTEWFLQTLNT